MPRRGGRAGCREATLDELADESWISVRGGFPVDDVLQWVAAATSVRRRVVQRINDFRVIEEPLLAGHGVALVPRYCRPTLSWSATGSRGCGRHGSTS